MIPILYCGYFIIARSDCTDQANAYAQDVFTIDCPSGCGDISGNLWGTGIYTDDSFICSAAIHDGRIIGDLLFEIYLLSSYCLVFFFSKQWRHSGGYKN